MEFFSTPEGSTAAARPVSRHCGNRRRGLQAHAGSRRHLRWCARSGPARTHRRRSWLWSHIGVELVQTAHPHPRPGGRVDRESDARPRHSRRHRRTANNVIKIRGPMPLAKSDADCLVAARQAFGKTPIIHPHVVFGRRPPGRMFSRLGPVEWAMSIGRATRGSIATWR